MADPPVLYLIDKDSEPPRVHVGWTIGGGDVFAGFRLARGTTPGFDPAANVIADEGVLTSGVLDYVDAPPTSGKWYYRIAGVFGAGWGVSPWGSTPWGE